MFLLQPISQNMNWQVERSLQALSIVKGPAGVFGQGVPWKSVSSWLRCCPSAFRHLMENWGGWCGAGSLVERGEQQWESVDSALDSAADKKLFEVKRKDQMNALKNLIELNDINQQYKIIDIMLKGLFKVSHSAGCTLSPQGGGGRNGKGWGLLWSGS